MITNFAIRVGANALALWAAAGIVNGIELSSRFLSIVFVSIIFGIVNALIKPVATLLSLPAIVLTLGLFTLVVNAAMLGITAAIADSLSVDSFGASVLGAIVISAVSWGLSVLLDDDR